MKLALDRIAEFLSATGEFDYNAVAQGYSIDSRTVKSGELFFAVKGERLDGHDFVEPAFEKGAVAKHIDEKGTPVEVPLGEGFTSLIGPYGHWVLPDGRFKSAFTADRRHINAHGVVHGGMLAAFADHMLYEAAHRAACDKPCVTASLTCEFITFCTLGARIEGYAKVTRATRSLVFVTGEILTSKHVLVTAHGVWKIVGEA